VRGLTTSCHYHTWALTLLAAFRLHRCGQVHGESHRADDAVRVVHEPDKLAYPHNGFSKLKKARLNAELTMPR
jgi:hypothetical protein